MNKIYNYVIVFACFVFYSNYCFAFECWNCNVELEEGTNTCPSCDAVTTGGLRIKKKTKQATIPETASIPNYVNDEFNNSKFDYGATNQKQVISDKDRTNVVIESVIPSEYVFINDIENLLTETTYKSANGQMILLKGQNESKLAALSKTYSLMNPYSKKLHDLHLSKLRYLDEYFDVWKNEDNGGSKSQCALKKEMKLYCIAKMNEAIDLMLCSDTKETGIGHAKRIESNLKKVMEIYAVTSPYLNLNKQRINRGGQLWVSKIEGNDCTVVYMGDYPSSKPLFGYISLMEMEKRTNWNSNAEQAYESVYISPEIENNRLRISNDACFNGRYPYCMYANGEGYSYSIIKPKLW